MITDAAGNASVAGYVTSYTVSTGALVVQVGLTFQLEIRSKDPYNRHSDYSFWYDWGGGAPGGPAPIILATLGTGLSIIDMGFLLINIPELTMRRLHHKSYLIALTATDSVNTRQIFIGRLPMLYGGVTL